MARHVEYRCVADGHPRRPLLSPDFALRVHLRAWAYCPAGERSGHEWERIDATAVEDLLAPDGGARAPTADPSFASD